MTAAAVEPTEKAEIPFNKQPRDWRKAGVIVAFSAIPVALLVIFTYWPFGSMIGYSFYKMKYIGPRQFVGLQNYIDVFTRPDTLSSLKLSLYYMVGALIMFYMALRSVRARQQLRTKGVCVQATVSGTVQSRDGAAYVLEFTTAGGSHRLQYPKPSRSKDFAEGSVVTLYYDPEAPEKMYVEGDKSVLGAEALYAGIGVALLVLMFALL